MHTWTNKALMHKVARHNTNRENNSTSVYETYKVLKYVLSDLIKLYT
jgi:hypothetical protein